MNRVLPVITQERVAQTVRPLRVALVVMPFASTLAPSIQIGLLQRLAERAGHRCESFYLNLELAARLGFDPYEQLAHLPLPLLGEWLFTTAAFDEEAADRQSEFLSTFDLERIEARVGMDRKELVEFKQHGAREFIEQMVHKFALHEFDVVGLSSVFQQTVPSLALARRIKECQPKVVTIFGGANFQGEMGLELVRRLDSVDWVSVGEADDSFPAFLNAIASGADPADIPNIAGGLKSAVRVPSLRPMTEELDRLPTPKYDDFFSRAEDLQLASRIRAEIDLPIEASRGCWWGAKHHCTFCGLDPAAMKFRAKSADRVLAELTEQAARHATFKFLTTDAIVDLDFFKTLFPTLVDRGIQLELFFEVKSNIGRDKLRVMRQAGVGRIQPGIESLSTEVLRLMNKGVTGIQNINFLRWSRYYNFDVDWNLIWGFPGETPQSYDALARLVPQLLHLTPPANMGPVQMHRFSPMFRERERFPVRFRRAEQGYRYVFPRSIDVDAVAYYFDYEFEQKLPSETYVPLSDAVETWRARWKTESAPYLQYRYSPGVVQIHDGRKGGTSREYTLRGAVADLYAACSEKPLSLAQLYRLSTDTLSTEAELEALMGELTAFGLMAQEGQSFLALALPAGAPT